MIRKRLMESLRGVGVLFAGLAFWYGCSWLTPDDLDKRAHSHSGSDAENCIVCLFGNFRGSATEFEQRYWALKRKHFPNSRPDPRQRW